MAGLFRGGGVFIVTNDNGLDIRKITLAVPEIGVSDVLESMGMPRDTDKVNRVIMEAIQETMEEAKKNLLTPIASVRMSTVTMGDDGIFMLDGIPCPGIPPEKLKGVEGMAVIFATLGPALESRMSEYLSEGDSLKGMILDALGSCAVVEAVGSVRAIIEQELLDGDLGYSDDLEPGLGEVDLGVQGIAHEVGGAASIGITIGDNLLLHPKKTVSILKPFGTNPAVSKGCGGCCGKEVSSASGCSGCVGHGCHQVGV